MHRYHLVPLLCSLLLTVGCYQNSSPSPRSALETLVALMRDRDASVRRTAADALGKIGDPIAEPFLIRALGDGDPSVREAAARSLGRFPTFGAEAAGELVLRLEDPDRSVQRAAAQALGTAEWSLELGRSLAGLLGNSHVEVRQAAAHALSLADAHEPSEFESLAARAHDSDANVRQWAVAALGESGSGRALPILMDRVRHDPAEAVRGEAAYRIQFVANESDVKVLDSIAAEERSPAVRAWIQKSRLALKKEFGSGSVPRPIQPGAPAHSDRYP